MGHENDGEGGYKFKAIYSGTVVDNADPMKLGRVRVSIEGLLKKSDWARPVGGGAKKRGQLIVPPRGAEVAVFFHGGDQDHPRYIPGYYGTGEVPGYLGGLDGEVVEPADADKVPCLFEGTRYVVQIDERPGKEKLFVKDKKSGDHLTHDGVVMGWEMKGTSQVKISCDGQVDIDGISVRIKGRNVRPGVDPI